MRSMFDREVWRKQKKIPNDRRLIGNKWVLKIKRGGTYRARLVALGYSQIPGVDYTDNFAPVAHDVTFRIALVIMMVEKLDSLVMDVETAFLYGETDEEIFMKSPVGMEEIDPGSTGRRLLPTINRNIWLVSSRQTILEEICQHSKKGIFFIPSESCRSLYVI